MDMLAHLYAQRAFIFPNPQWCRYRCRQVPYRRNRFHRDFRRQQRHGGLYIGSGHDGQISHDAGRGICKNKVGNRKGKPPHRGRPGDRYRGRRRANRSVDLRDTKQNNGFKVGRAQLQRATLADFFPCAKRYCRSRCHCSRHRTGQLSGESRSITDNDGV